MRHNARKGVGFHFSTVGVLNRSYLIDMSEKTITNDIQTNYISQVMLVKNAIPLMNQDSSIVLFGSSSYTRGRASYSIYSSTKAALVNFVQAVAEEIVDKG